MFPLTTFGTLVLFAASLPLIRLAYAEMDLVALMVGDAFVALPLLSVVAVASAAVVLRRRVRRILELPAAVLDTNKPFESAFELPSLRFLPFLSISYRVRVPDQVETTTRGTRGRLRETLRFRDRGIVAALEREIDVRDVFGLARITFSHTQTSALTVMPNVGAFREMHSLTSFAGGDEIGSPLGLTQGDRTELRRYAPRDPARFIHWKAYARTQRLLVRQPERALARARRTLAYLIAGPNDDASAGIARAALVTKAFGDDWLFGADGSTSDATNTALAERLIVESVGARSSGAAGFAAFLSRAEKNGPASCVLFVPPRPGPWLTRLLPTLRARHPMRVLIGVESAPVASKMRAWLRLLLRATESRGTDASELDAVVRALRAVRAEVTVLNRETGRAVVHKATSGASADRERKRKAA